MPRMIERGQSLLLFALVAGNLDSDMGMAGVGADMHFRHIHRRQAGIAHFEAYDFGKFFPDGFGHTLDAMLIHLNRAIPPLRPRGRAPAACWPRLPPIAAP